MRPAGTILRRLQADEAMSWNDNSKPSETIESNATASASEPAAPATTMPEDELDEALQWLWLAMAGRYGYRWDRQFGQIGGPAFEVWRLDLQGLSPSQIKLGFHKCRSRANGWPPGSLEFRALCQVTPAELGLPDETAAFRAACQQRPDWAGLHPIIWHARQDIGAWELTHEPVERLWPRFQAVYQRLVQRALAGETFAYPPELAVPRLAWEKPKVITAPGDARAHVQHLLALLRRGRGTLPSDPTTVESEERQS